MEACKKNLTFIRKNYYREFDKSQIFKQSLTSNH
jgi:hypothetical protein